jgi:protein SCO1/2
MDRKLIWVGVGILGIVIAATIATALLARPPEFYATVYEPKPAAEFKLPTAETGEFRLGEQKGKIVLLFFGYTNCYDVCPTTMANMKQAVAQMGAEAQNVRVVFVTVDPERDTLQGVQKYAAAFDPSFIGLSGTTAELEKVWNQYGVFRELGAKDANGNYEVTHTARITVIDPQGDLRLSINYDATWQDILHDLQLLADDG